jgi:hypothetical protein
MRHIDGDDKMHASQHVVTLPMAQNSEGLRET